MSTAETTTAIAESKPEPTTTVDLVIRLQVKGSPAEVAEHLGALQCLASVMATQAEDGLNTAVLELVKECGWDWEADPDYVAFAIRATAEEGLVEGLLKALAAVRAQYLDHVARREATLS
ncbi:MAG TPA: hypothetical protein VLE97_02045 [Gaiellaceae bacterium]|nr:hypothetical protein [Gaiellaceae bacterium]